MILGIGVDAVQIARIQKALTIPNFKESTFTLLEIKNCHGDEATYYAGRFACKEAVFKAVGKPEDWRLIEILNDIAGKPYVTNREDFTKMAIHLSITTEGEMAIAFCVVEV